MSQPDRDCVRKYREEEGNQKKGKSKKNKRTNIKRKVAQAKTDSADADEDDHDSEVPPQSLGAGAQFGANGNKKTKAGK
jgi:hypothetical protein